MEMLSQYFIDFGVETIPFGTLLLSKTCCPLKNIRVYLSMRTLEIIGKIFTNFESSRAAMSMFHRLTKVFGIDEEEN
jgi:hypothetical protein